MLYVACRSLNNIQPCDYIRVYIDARTALFERIYKIIKNISYPARIHTFHTNCGNLCYEIF